MPTQVTLPHNKNRDLTAQGSLLRATAISKQVSDFFSISDVSIELDAGQVHVLLGENGAGKSSLIKILAGIVIPDKGEIYVADNRVQIASPAMARSLGIAVAHQQLVQFPEMSVASNILLSFDPHNRAPYTGSSAENKARSLLADLGFLTEIPLRDIVAHLSAGQRKLLQIACALVQHTQIIILDDPTAYLSDESSSQIRNLVAKLKDQNRAILYACHRLDEAKAVADRVTILRDGRSVASICNRQKISSASLLMGTIGVLFNVRAVEGLPIDFASRNCRLELGYDCDALVCKHVTFGLLVAPEDRERVLNIERDFAAASADYLERQYRMLHADGTSKWVHELAKMVRDSNGTVVSYDIGVMDIEEADTAQAMLRQSEHKYEMLVSNIPDVVYSVKPGGLGARLFVSQRWQDWTGQSGSDNFRGDCQWIQCVHQEDRSTVTKAYSQLCGTGADYCLEYRIVHKQTGETRYVMDRAVPVKNGDGRIIRFDGLISDITRLKTLESELRHSREFLFHLFAVAPVPILLFNADSSLRYTNSSFEKLTGFTESEVIGHNCPYPWTVTDQKANDDSATTVEELCKKKSGGLFWIERSSVRVCGPLGEVVRLEIWKDITKGKQLAKNLRSYANLVTKAQEDDRKKIARELHDETMQSLFSLCTELDSLTTRYSLKRNTAQDIESISNRLGTVIDSLRSFCHDIRPDLLDRFGLVDTVELLVRETDKRTGMKGLFQVCGRVRPMPGDLQLGLFRITQEAINNIRKHACASEFGVTLTFSDNCIEVSISDNGTGFELPEALNDLAPRGKLGLIGMSERASLLLGELSIVSKTGTGTVVSVRAPITTDGDSLVL